MRAAALALLAGCWTGGPAMTPPANEARPAPPPSRFAITLERTPCLGFCPTYRVTIDGDGRVRWHGDTNVATVGDRRSTIPPRYLRDVEAKLAEVRFFERDEHGELGKSGMECVKHGSTTSCSFSTSVTICSDTTRAVITVRRGAQRHTVTNDHCDDSPLDELEALIDNLARTRQWIGK